MPRSRLLLLPLVTILLGGAAAPAVAAGPHTGTGSTLDSAIEAFRADVGATSDTEVTWEESDLPDPLPNPFTYGTLQVATDGSGFEVGDFGPAFESYSPPNMLQANGTMTIEFVMPGTTTPATNYGLGVVFSHVTAGSSKIELLDAHGQTLQTITAPAGDLSFAGTSSSPRITTVRVTTGGALVDNVIFGHSQPDPDQDGSPTSLDNCPNTSNFFQQNIDRDALGDACDPDADNDRIPNERDAFPLDKSENTDTDGDGIGDNKDADDDNDGLTDRVEGRLGTDRRNPDTDADGAIDGQDNCPAIPNPTQADANGDGRGDACADMIAPALTKLALRPASFRRGSKYGTRLSFRLSEPAVVRFKATRLVTGHRVGAGCALGRPRARKHELACRVFAPVRGTIGRNGTSGTNFVKFIGRMGGRWMKPGSYRLFASATDRAGNPAAKFVQAEFTILP